MLKSDFEGKERALTAALNNALFPFWGALQQISRTLVPFGYHCHLCQALVHQSRKLSFIYWNKKEGGVVHNTIVDIKLQGCVQQIREELLKALPVGLHQASLPPLFPPLPGLPAHSPPLPPQLVDLAVKFFEVIFSRIKRIFTLKSSIWSSPIDFN